MRGNIREKIQVVAYVFSFRFYFYLDILRVLILERVGQIKEKRDRKQVTMDILAVGWGAIAHVRVQQFLGAPYEIQESAEEKQDRKIGRDGCRWYGSYKNCGRERVPVFFRVKNIRG